MSEIHLWGVKQNNLKNIEVKIPLGSFTVVCGPSGSGKSSLAFQTLFAEGQRRFIESLSHYARQFLNTAPKPDIEGIKNIPPTIAIEQKNTIKNSRSTVGTSTEMVDYVRLLYEKLGVSHCPTHHIPTEKESVTDATIKILKHFKDERGYILVEVDPQGRVATGKKLHALLLQDSYLRIYIPPQTLEEQKSKLTLTSLKKSVSKIKATAKAKLKSKSQTQVQAQAQTKITEPASANSNSKLNSDSKGKSKKTSRLEQEDLKEAKGTSQQTIFTQEAFGEVVEIGGPEAIKKGLPDGLFYIVIDRMQFLEEDKGRISDSMAQAYEASHKLNKNFKAKRATILTTDGKKLQVSEDECCPICGYEPPLKTAKLFSFNSPYGACPTCKGFGNILTLDEKKVIPNPRLSIQQGALSPFTMPSAAEDQKELFKFCRKNKIQLDRPWDELPTEHRDLIWKGTSEFMGVEGLFAFLEEMKYKMHVRVFIARFRSPYLCPDCQGSRLRKDVHHILFRGYSLVDLCRMTIRELTAFFEKNKLTKTEKEHAQEVFDQIHSRLNFLMRVGVHYLTLDRETRTLSGGEYQRLLLAHQLGMSLSETLYVLDEPTVGLHPRDNDRLISILKDLKNLGNTLVIVEHDHDVIKSSEHIIEMGPGSGHLGGEIVYSGDTADFWDFKNSVTAPYFKKGASKKERVVRPVELPAYKFKIDLKGASGHNLKHLDVVFPLNRLVAITGVSGSGKSTLVTKTLYPALARALDIEYIPHQPYTAIEGVDHIKNVVLLDQSPIGRSIRSNCLTYLKVYDVIRNILASTERAKAKGIAPGHFSLNVDGGRCPVCKGLGVEEVEMMFMDNVMLPCEACDGKKFIQDVLDVEFQGRNINDILNLTVEEAMQVFVNYPPLRKSLAFLKEVGLEYLRLGQSSGSLSGGESQRLKIAKELSQVSQKSTLYILDEPTTGLHFREVNMLMRILHKLIDAGSSVIVVEHNLDVISGADYVIDLGPEGGQEGGAVVFAGSPTEITKCKESLTGNYLKAYLG